MVRLNVGTKGIDRRRVAGPDAVNWTIGATTIVTASRLVPVLLVAIGIGAGSCQPRSQTTVAAGRTAAASGTASPQPAQVASAPDPGVYNVRLKPPRMGQNPSDNHVFVLQGALLPGAQDKKSFTLPKLAGMSVLLVGEGVRYVFRSPHNETIIPGETKDRPGYRYVGEKEGAGFTLEDPDKGVWTVTIESKSGRSVNYAIDIRSDGPAEEAAHLETMRADSDPNLSFLARPGDPVFVRAFVTANGRPVKGVHWGIRAHGPKGNEVTIPVHDDGRHADGAAGDGVAVGAIVAEGPDGFYELRAAGRSPSGVEYLVTGTIEVQAHNDLLIADEIEVAPENPRAGEPVTLTATVLNAGTVDSRDVELEFYLGARKESSQRFDIKAGESKRITTTWTPGPANNYDVQLTINPFTEPYASDFENNTRRTVVQVR